MASRRHPERNIVLTGFYHSGKTAIGRALARRLHRPFIDVREELTRRSRARFPVLSGARRGYLSADPETRLMADLAFRRSTIVVLDPLSLEVAGTLEEFQVFSYIVYLDLPIELLWERELAHRAKLRTAEAQDPDVSQAEWLAKWEECRPLYMRADLTLDLCSLNPDMCARLIQHCFYT